MAQQLTLVDYGPPKSAEITLRYFTVGFSRSRHNSSLPASGCGRFGPVKM